METTSLLPLTTIPHLDTIKEKHEDKWSRISGMKETLRVIGLDIGIVVPCAETTIDGGEKDKVYNVVVSKRSMYGSNEKFQADLHQKIAGTVSANDRPVLIAIGNSEFKLES
jgi:hypothetical protein